MPSIQEPKVGTTSNLVTLSITYPHPFIADLAGKKELENYEEFIKKYYGQLEGIETALNDTLGDAWDFTLDPMLLQVREVTKYQLVLLSTSSPCLGCSLRACHHY